MDELMFYSQVMQQLHEQEVCPKDSIRTQPTIDICEVEAENLSNYLSKQEQMNEPY